MALKEWEERISAYLEESLDEREARAVEEHCRSCEECGEALAAAKRGHELFAGATLIAPVNIVPRISQQLKPLSSAPTVRPWPLIIVFLGVLGVIGLLAFHWSSGRANEERTGKSAVASPTQEMEPPVPLVRPKPAPAPVGVIAWRGEGGQKPSSVLPPESDVETPAGTCADVRLAGGECVAALPNTVFRTVEDGVTLIRGNIWCDIPHRSGSSPFIVHTNAADVIVIGTKFGVDVASDSISVDLFEGRVEIRLASGASCILEAGSTAVVSAGAIVVSLMPAARDALWRQWAEVPVLRRPAETVATGQQPELPASSSESLLPGNDPTPLPKRVSPRNVLGKHRLGQ